MLCQGAKGGDRVGSFASWPALKAAHLQNAKKCTSHPSPSPRHPLSKTACSASRT